MRSSAAYSVFFLNLFNLIPISPLDGGRITAVLSPKIWLLGAPILVGLFVMSPSPMLLVIGLLAAPQLMAAWRFRADDPAHAAYYSVSGETRVTYAAAYLGLLGFLGLMTHNVHLVLETLRPG